MKVTILAWVVSLAFAVIGWWPAAKPEATDIRRDVIEDGKTSEASPEVHTISSPRLS